MRRERRFAEGESLRSAFGADKQTREMTSVTLRARMSKAKHFFADGNSLGERVARLRWHAQHCVAEPQDCSGALRHRGARSREPFRR